MVGIAHKGFSQGPQASLLAELQVLLQTNEENNTNLSIYGLSFTLYSANACLIFYTLLSK